jgi:uncharacterized protein YndB with AHSA1/START domain
MKITVEALVAAPIDLVWQAWTTPTEITQWNAASDDWHCPHATVDLRPGGKFSSRMEAKDGSFGFDFEGTYITIVRPERLECEFGGRSLLVEFLVAADGVIVRETFDAEETNPVEMQRVGWQAILDRFANHVAARRA